MAEGLLASDVGLQEVTFIVNPVLPLCQFIWSLARLGVCCCKSLLIRTKSVTL